MILKYKNKRPFIEFGFSEVDKTVSVGEVFKVWVTGQMNTTHYTFNLACSGIAKVAKISDFEYNVSYAAPGEYELNLVMMHNSQEKKYIESNIITVFVANEANRYLAVPVADIKTENDDDLFIKAQASF